MNHHQPMTIEPFGQPKMQNVRDSGQLVANGSGSGCPRTWRSARVTFNFLFSDFWNFCKKIFSADRMSATFEKNMIQYPDNYIIRRENNNSLFLHWIGWLAKWWTAPPRGQSSSISISLHPPSLASLPHPSDSSFWLKNQNSQEKSTPGRVEIGLP